MPIFEFQCRDCGKVFERLMSRQAVENSCVICTCGVACAKRILSVPAPFQWGKVKRPGLEESITWTNT